MIKNVLRIAGVVLAGGIIAKMLRKDEEADEKPKNDNVIVFGPVSEAKDVIRMLTKEEVEAAKKAIEAEEKAEGDSVEDTLEIPVFGEQKKEKAPMPEVKANDWEELRKIRDQCSARLRS